MQLFVEAEAGSRERQRFDEQTLAPRDSEIVARPYPYPYGFLIGTRAADGDCVDCYLITPEPVAARTVVECVPVGLLLHEEDSEPDHKVLAVLPGRHTSLNEGLLDELRQFIEEMFAAYPAVRVRVGPLLPRAAAEAHLRQSRQE